MAKNLTQLTERTATADTDLLHVNAGRTDYKQTKLNFKKDLAHWVVLDSSTAITTQAEGLYTTYGTGFFAGKINSYGHQTETGVPRNNSFYVYITIYTTNYMKIEATDVDVRGTYVKYKIGGTWDADWIEDPTRNEMNNVKGKVKYIALIDAGTSKTFDITSGASSLVVSMSSDSRRCAVWFVYTAGSGNVYIFNLGTPGDQVSISSSTANKFTISNSSTISNKVMAIVFEGTISVAS